MNNLHRNALPIMQNCEELSEEKPNVNFIAAKLHAYVLFVRLFIIFSVLFTGAVIYGQTPQQLINAGNEAFNTSNYHSAVVYYQAYLQMTDTPAFDIIYKLAETHRHLLNYSEAFDNYLKVWQKAPDKYPEAGFWAAMMLKSSERYNEASVLLDSYIEHIATIPTLASIKERAVYERAACDSVLKMLQNPLNVKIKNIEEINTVWNEFNPVQLDSITLVFSALKPLIETDNPLLGKGGYKAQIYTSKFGTSGFRKPVSMSENINAKDVHTANIAFTSYGNRAYFNRCEYKNYKLRCDIWISEKKNRRWSKATKLPEPLNTENYTTTQPFVTIDSVSGHDLLYFVSDRPGGFGGLDLWFCIIKDAIPQKPINLGSIINTPGDEITPFYHAYSKTLYFSSDWHYGFGGFDIFSANGALSSWEKPVNAGSPLNTGSNDFYFSFSDENEGYLTSNRPGSMTFNDETCCNDIYFVEILREKKIIEVVELTDTIEQSVSKEILELLPISLYFDNDHPDPRTTKTTTQLTYKQTWTEYMKQKRKFANEYSAELKGNDKYNAISEINEFFSNYVEAGFSKLEILTELMFQDLKAGSNVTLKVRGFTSPLTSAEYNILLSKRRISSLRNYFYEWNDNALKPYMNFTAENGATLQIIEEPAGEALTNPYVSDNPDDRKKSVYSKTASMERRIEILIYESDFSKYINIDENAPMIKIPKNIVQLNKFIDNYNIEIEVPIINPANVLLKINSIVASSDNITILSQPEIIEPKQEAIIHLKINGKIDRSFNEYIIIHSNTAEEKNVIYFTAFMK